MIAALGGNPQEQDIPLPPTVAPELSRMMGHITLTRILSSVMVVMRVS